MASVFQSELQTLVNEAAASSGAIGAQVSVIVGANRFDCVHGSANIELGVPMTVDTVVQIGSVTKLFNAAIVMTLVDEKKLTLETPVASYIPNLRLSDSHATETITLQHLLSMSSGLDNGAYAESDGGGDALERHIGSLRDIPQAFAPGEGFGYSNAGTSIAGYAAQLVAGRSWDTLLRERILEPAGLNHAVSLAQDLPFQRVSAGHTPARLGVAATVIRPWYLTQAQGPAGSTLAMSARDLASFGQLFINAGKTAANVSVLPRTAVEAMTTAIVDVPTKSFADAWGLGPDITRCDGGLVLGHQGSNQSGCSLLKWFPDKQGVLAITVNTPAAANDFRVQIAKRFSAAVFNVEYRTLVVPEAPLAIDKPDRFVGTFVAHGMVYEVSAHERRLFFRAINLGRGKPGDVPGITADSELVALGDERFAFKLSDGDALEEVAFFGRDEQGRATALVAPLFPAHRAIRA